jgi:hypothetical protein
MCREWSDELTEIMADALRGKRVPQHVVYPYAAYDLATAVATFKDADTYTLVDGNSFLVLDNHMKPYPTSSMGSYRYSPYSELGSKVEGRHKRAKGMLGCILGKMAVFHPSFRLRDVRYYIERRGSLQRNAAVHGAINFDLGEDDRLRTAIFIQHTIGGASAAPLHRRLWSHHLNFADGLLVRGAMVAFNKPLAAREAALSTIEANGGVVVEGYNMIGVEGHEVWKRSEDVPPSAQTYPADDFQLSYRKGMRVVMFGE